MGHMTGGSPFWSQATSFSQRQRYSAGISEHLPVSGSLHSFQMVHASISSGPCETHASVNTSHTLRHSHPSPPLTPCSLVSAQAVTPRTLSDQTREKKQSEKCNAVGIYLPELG